MKLYFTRWHICMSLKSRDLKCILRDGFRDFIFNVFCVKYLKDSDKCNTYNCDKLYLVLLLRNAYRITKITTLVDGKFKRLYITIEMCCKLS